MNRYSAAFIGVAYIWFIAFVVAGGFLGGAVGIVVAEVVYLALLTVIGVRLLRT